MMLPDMEAVIASAQLHCEHWVMFRYYPGLPFGLSGQPQYITSGLS
jgi:hypothetical protein